MFCTNCGQKLSAEFEFCINCGTKIANEIKEDIVEEVQSEVKEELQIQEAEENKNELSVQEGGNKEVILGGEKEKLISEQSVKKVIHDKTINMTKENLLYNYMRIKEALEELSSLRIKGRKLNTQLDEVKQEEQNILNPLRVGLGLLCGLSGFIIFLYVNIFLAVIVGLFLMGLGANWSYSEEEEKKHQREADKFHNENVVPLEERILEIKNKIDILQKSEEISLFEQLLPEAYRNLEALEFFIQALQNRRADTEKELFNLYEDELNKRKVLEIQRKQLKVVEQLNKQSKDQLKNLNDIKDSQKKLSRQVRYGNTINTLDFLNKRK